MGDLELKLAAKLDELYYNRVEAYDCSEMVQDMSLIAAGDVYRLVNKEKFKSVLVIENGKRVRYEYHEFFAHHGLAYDPLYSPNPVALSKYLNMLKALNSSQNVQLQISKARVP